MFHEMSDESRTALIALFTECQDQILIAEGVERSNSLPGLMGLDGELRPGIGHAYMHMYHALQHLRAPMASASERIERTFGSGLYRRHSSGCYTIARVSKSWHVGRYAAPGEKERLWVIAPTDSSKREFFVHRRGDRVPYVAGNNWLSVLDVIAEYCGD